MEKINIHAILEEIHIHFFTNSQTIARQELGDDTFFHLELVAMEIFGILSFLKKNRLPNDLESRVSRLKDQETRMTTILTKQVSYSTRQIVLSIELARTWALYCMSEKNEEV